MWARIADGVVSEVTDIDPHERFHSELTWLNCPAHTKAGWAYDGEAFTATQVDSPTVAGLCVQIDSVADTVRQQLAGDALLAVEHERAAAQAEAFKAAGYQGDVPPMVAAWAINGRSAEQAAHDILVEAAQYNQVIEQVRSLRLAGKEQVRALIAAGNNEQAVVVTDSTLIALNALRSSRPYAD